MTTPQPDFRRGLEDLEQALKDSPMPASLRKPPWRHRRAHGPIRLGLGVAAVAALALALPWPSAPLAPSVPEAPPEPTTQVVFSSPDCMPAKVEAHLSLRKGCSIKVSHPDLVIEALADSEVEHTHRGLSIVQGGLQISVASLQRAQVPPIWVSGGRIEAVAGQLTVQQALSGSGSVRVDEGSAVFVADGAGPVALAQGATRRWSRSGPRLPPAQWSKARIDREVAAASQARAEGQYQQARERLSQLLKAPVGEGVAEIMSFELGGLLERKLRDSQASCAHWREHQRRFDGGTYGAQVAQSIVRCKSGNFEGREE